jgi:hypothetical protein
MPARSRTLPASLSFLVALIGACDDGFTPPSNMGLIAVFPATVSELADGATTVLITARVDTTARAVNATVSFATTAGMFTSGTASAQVPANDSGLARVALRAPSEPANAIVTASTAGTTKSTTVSFVVAPPTGMVLLPDAFRINTTPGTSTKLTATLFRTRGAPSPGTPVNFSVTRVGGGSLPGHLTAETAFAAATNTATTTFVVDSAIVSTVVFRATATRGAATVSDTTIVRVTP